MQLRLGIDVGLLGTVLLATAAGALAGMVVAARLTRRFGSGPVTRISTVVMCACLVLPGLAWDAWSLAAALFVYGAAAGLMDVAMNTEASAVDTAHGRPVMVGFHAMFSFGGIVGAVVGSLAAGARVAPAVHLTAVGATMTVAGLMASRGLGARPKGALVEEPGGGWGRWRGLIGLGVLAFCILLGEGAIGDWSAVYLQSMAGAGVAPLGYAVFSLAMALGRLGGDWGHARLGSAATVRWGGMLAASGLGIALMLGGVPATLAGFACVGLGFAASYPILCSVAGRRTGDQPQAGIAVVAGTGYLGFVVGPPVIGFVAQASSLRMGLAVVVALSAVSAAMAGMARD
jgi:MFS family permease